MLKCYWQVTAGMILGEIDSKHTRRFEITSQEWSEAKDRQLLVMSRSFEVSAYVTILQLRSANGLEPNWVNIEYAWL